MGSLRQIRESRVRPPVIRETDFELNPAWRQSGLQAPLPDAADIPEEQNESELQGFHKDYRNPDTLFMTPGAVAFIYTTTGKVYYGDENTTHYEIIGEHEELLISRYRLYGYYQDQGLPIGTQPVSGMNEGLVREEADNDGALAEPQRSAVSSSQDPKKKRCGFCRNYIAKETEVCPLCDGDPSYVDPYGSSYQSEVSSEPSSGPRRINSDGDYMEPRDVATTMGDLLGRIGKQKMLVSFWNDDPSQYDAHLRPCLEKLVADGQLSPHAQISTPTHGTIPMQEAMAGAQGKALTDEQREQMELYKRLHLMRGQEKHEAMKKLGVGGGGVPHPMQSAMRGAGLLGPGQKWWAPHSESFNRRLGAVLKNL